MEMLKVFAVEIDRFLEFENIEELREEWIDTWINAYGDDERCTYDWFISVSYYDDEDYIYDFKEEKMYKAQELFEEVMKRDSSRKLAYNFLEQYKKTKN